jgi:hypothetical protein
MRRAVAAPYAERDYPALTASLERLVDLNPAPDNAKWLAWNGHARTALTAAKREKAQSAVKSCAACHVKYRRRYQAAYRERPVDPGQ